MESHPKIEPPQRISVSYYREVERQASMRALGWIMGAFCLGLPLSGSLGALIAIFVRDTVGGDWGMGIGLFILLVFITIPLALMLRFLASSDRKNGIRCPACGKSLTADCHPEKVLATRKCSHCKATVLYDDGKEVDSAGRSSEALWVLSLLAVAGVAVAVALHWSGRGRPIGLEEFAYLAMLATPFLLLGLLENVVRRLLIRRWRRQASEDSRSPGAGSTRGEAP